MQLVGLIGYPLKHSLSPAFQQAALDHFGLDVRYEAWETEPARVGEIAGMLKDDRYLGMNITVPHKETIMEFLDYIDPIAKQIGAVNTVVKIDGKLKGYNTDATGFLRALKQEGGVDPKGKKAILLGAGGAARAVAFALVEAGASQVVVSNRHIDRAQALVEDLRGVFATGTPGRQEIDAVVLPSKHLEEKLRLCDLIVNCTSVGMSHSAGEGLSPLDRDLISEGVLVYDLVYTPGETPLLLNAKACGAKTLGGLPMLVYQGAAAFELWTGKTAPIPVMMSAAVKALAEKENR